MAASRRPGYNRGMNGQSELDATFALVWTITGTLIVAYVIGSVVRWINRRDDPRCAKPPPDDP